MVRVNAIVGIADNRVIGLDNKLPWHLPADLKRFKELTMGCTVLMGRKTFESLPEKFRPLPGRVNVVVSRTKTSADFPSEVQVVADPEAYISAVKQGEIEVAGDILWVIGGQKIYELLLPFCDGLFLTRIHSSHPGDAFFPPYESDFEVLAIEEGEGYSFQQLGRVTTENVRP